MIIFIEVPVLSQESEWSWYEYRSACIKPRKWVVMIFFFIEVPVLSQESEWSWYFVIEVPVLSQESEWSWYEYRSACITPGKWVVMIWV